MITGKTKTKLVFILCLTFWLGYETHKVELFPLNRFIERTFKKGKADLDQTIHIPKDRTEIECPAPESAYTVIGFGQSNSANNGGHRYTSKPDEKILSFFDGKCFIAKDPMLGALGFQGSVWIPLARKLKTNKPVVFLTLGVGGSKVAQWLDPNNLYPFYEASIEKFKSTYPNPDLIIWIQGEDDKQTAPGVFKAQLEKWLDTIKTDFPISQISLTGTSYCHGSGAKEIVTAQRDAAAQKGALFLGETDTFTDAAYRYDGCHFSERGLEAVSGMIAQKINAIQSK